MAKYRVRISRVETQYADVVASDAVNAEFYATIGANLSEKTEKLTTARVEVLRQTGVNTTLSR